MRKFRYAHNHCSASSIQYSAHAIAFYVFPMTMEILLSCCYGLYLIWFVVFLKSTLNGLKKSVWSCCRAYVIWLGRHCIIMSWLSAYFSLSREPTNSERPLMMSSTLPVGFLGKTCYFSHLLKSSEEMKEDFKFIKLSIPEKDRLIYLDFPSHL